MDKVEEKSRKYILQNKQHKTSDNLHGVQYNISKKLVEALPTYRVFNEREIIFRKYKTGLQRKVLNSAKYQRYLKHMDQTHPM